VFRVLFLNFHFFPAAKEFPFPTASHNKFRTTNRANISFANLIRHFIKYLPLKSNTTTKKGGLMNPLKGGNFDIHFHRRDAEHAEDLFYFFAFR
jgi:hypothetical protein